MQAEIADYTCATAILLIKLEPYGITGPGLTLLRSTTNLADNTKGTGHRANTPSITQWINRVQFKVTHHTRTRRQAPTHTIHADPATGISKLRVKKQDGFMRKPPTRASDMQRQTGPFDKWTNRETSNLRALQRRRTVTCVWELRATQQTSMSNKKRNKQVPVTNYACEELRISVNTIPWRHSAGVRKDKKYK